MADSQSPADILAFVQQSCAEVLRVPIENVTPEARFLEDLDTDSLFATLLAVELEERFVLELPEKDLAEISTVQEMADYIAKRLEGA